MFFGVASFEVTFGDDVLSNYGMPGAAKVELSREMGCKNHVLTEGLILSILGTVWGVILDPKIVPNSQCGSLWGSSDAKWGTKWRSVFA